MSTMSGKSLFFVGLLALTWSCSKKEAPKAEEQQPASEALEEAEPAEPAENPVQAARVLFKTRCAVCHGETGKGDGPGSAALNPKPRNYSDPEWQKQVTDEQIKSTILMGGAAVGKSPIMPASPDLNEKPEVTAELVKVVRSFAGK